MTAPELNLLTAHKANIAVYNGIGYRCLQPKDRERLPRARLSYDAIGRIGLDAHSVPLYIAAIQEGEVDNLPPPKEGVYNIVSKMTAYAAGPDRTDLYFLYGDRRLPDGHFQGVKGIGRPVFQRRPIPIEAPVFPASVAQIVNTAGYPMKLYAPDTPDLITGSTCPMKQYPPEQRPTQLCYEDNDVLDHELSEAWGINVYTEPKVVGVENVTGQPGDAVLRIANPNVVLTLGYEGIARGYVAPTMEVRNGDPQSDYYMSVLGGRALALFAPPTVVI